MKKLLITLSILFIVTAFICRPLGTDETFKQLHALEGKWMMKTKKGSMGEEWMKVSDNHMQNKGFYIRGVDTLVTERVTLKRTAAGIFYTSVVEDQNNKQPVSFRLTSSEKQAFVFENPQHDFPKRIVYKLVSPDSIHAYIDGGAAVAGKRQDFYYHKVN